MLDIAAPYTYGEPFRSYFDKLGKDVKHIHFIDCTRDSEDHLIPGDGTVDFTSLIHYLEEIGYEGYLSLELFTRYEPEPYFAADKGMRVFREILAD